MLRAKRPEFFWFVLPLVTFWAKLVANEVKKLSNEFVWDWKEGSLETRGLS